MVLINALKLVFHLCICAIVACTNVFAADVVVINAKIWTGSAKTEFAEAMAIDGDRIIAVGDNEEIKTHITVSTKIVDGKGKTIIPGFNDAHVHFMTIGFSFFSINFQDILSANDFLNKIKYHAAMMPDDTWIRGVNLNATKIGLEDLALVTLDKASSKHPVFIYNSDITKAHINSIAAKSAGLKPEMSGFGKDANGNFNGEITGTSLERVKHFLPRSEVRDLSAIMQTATNYAASLGITSVQDVHSDDLFDIYADLENKSLLKTRVYDCIELRHYAKLSNLRKTKMVRNGCLKGFSDGDEESFEKLRDQVIGADKAKLQVMVHAIGPTPNDIVLRTFETADKVNGKRDRRYRIEHAHNVSPDDVIRFKQTKTIASMQPHLFGNYGERDQYFAMFTGGVDVAFGSDAPMKLFDPLLGIYESVNGMVGKKHLSLTESLRAYTFGAAFAEFQELEKGEIKVGKLADFVILSDDIFKLESKKIKDVKVIETFVGGRSVFRSETN